VVRCKEVPSCIPSLVCNSASQLQQAAAGPIACIVDEGEHARSEGGDLNRLHHVRISGSKGWPTGR
jgi:hypothetical protein